MWILGGIVVLQVTGSAERGDAHPQQPFTIIYSRLLKYERKRKSVRGGRGEREVSALRADAEIKLARGPKTTKLHMLRSEE